MGMVRGAFKRMEIRQSERPGYVWVCLLSEEGPTRAFEATVDQLFTMGQMMIEIAVRLPTDHN